jgi:hypothetical protein
MSEFNWWLLIVGLVIGAGLVWLILSDSQRTESRAADQELADEADWIATTLADAGQPLDEAEVEQVLRLHRTWLATLPPEDGDDWTAEEAPEGTAEGTDEGTDEAATQRTLEPTAAAAAPPAGVPAPRDATDDADYVRDGGAGTTPVWSATEPSPRRR